MYVCHHCGYISHNDNVNYCNNVNCKYYGRSDYKPAEPQMPQSTDMNEGKTAQKRSLMKMDSMTYNYEGDINYPSDKRMDNTGNMNYDMRKDMGMDNMNDKRMDNMGNMNYDMRKDMGMNSMDYKKPMSDMSRDKRMDGSMGYDKRMNNMEGMGYGRNTEGMNRMEMKDMRDKAYKADDSCGSLAFATVPMQKSENLYTPKEAMRAGTLFPSLNMPYDKKIIWRG